MAKYQEVAAQGQELRKGPWLEEEDEQLVASVNILGERKWDYIAKASGLKRSGKSCRMRWLNYLRPNIKRGNITAEEEQLIVQLHTRWGNKWSRIARSLPGRTDNEIKNYWRTCLSKKVLAQHQEGKVLCKAPDDKPEILRQTDDTSSSDQGTIDFNVDHHELSSFKCLNSPYEAGLLHDWMIELNDKIDGFNDFSSNLSLNSWNSDDSDDTIILDYSDSLWNI